MTTLQNDEQSLRNHTAARAVWKANQQWYKLNPSGQDWRRLGEAPRWNTCNRYALLSENGALYEFETVNAEEATQVSDHVDGKPMAIAYRTPKVAPTEADPTPPAPPRLSDGQVGGTHYKDMAVSPFDEIKALLTRAEWLGFLKGNYLKYKRRAGLKGDAAQDEAKAQHYWEVLQRELAEGLQHA